MWSASGIYLVTTSVMAARGGPAGSLSPGSLQKALTGAISTVLTKLNKSASATHRRAPSNTILLLLILGGFCICEEKEAKESR